MLGAADVREFDRILKETVAGLPYVGRGTAAWLLREWASTRAELDALRARGPLVPAWVVVALAVVYLLCPIDIISDQAGIVGFLDDLVVLLIATLYTLLFT